MKELSELSPEQHQLMELLLQEAGTKAEHVLPIPKRPEPNIAPLSSAQQRMWFAYRQSPEDVSYNIQTTMRIKGRLNLTALNQALSELVQRHETLRTSFEDRDGQPYQIIHPAKAVTAVVIEAANPQVAAAIVQAQAAKPWDLQTADSLRVSLIQCAPDEHLLLLGMHHILSDAWSVSILKRELWHIYDAILTNQALKLPELATTYGDYAHWERQIVTKSEQASHDFWAQTLRDAPTLLHLPLDRQRHESQTSAASIHHWRFPAQTSANILALAQANRCSTFAVCLAGLYLVLGELSASRDVLVACPVANRERAELEQMIGYFANTIVARGQWSQSTSFDALVQQVHDLSLETLAHQAFPFERIVEETNPRRIHGVNPLAQVFFAFQQHAPDAMAVHELDIEPYEHAWRSTQFDLEIHAWQSPNGNIEAAFIYPDLIAPDSAAQWAQRWCDILESATARPLVCASTWIEPRRKEPDTRSETEIHQRIKTLLEQSDSIERSAVIVDQTPVGIERLAPEDLYSQNMARPTQPQSNTRHQVDPTKSDTIALITGAKPAKDLPVDNLASLLQLAADHYPNSSLRFLPEDTEILMPELLTQAKQIQAGLEAAGVKPADTLLLQLDSERDVITHFWGAIFAGAKPLIQLPIHPEQPQPYEQLVAVWNRLERPTVLVCQVTKQTWRDLDAQAIDIATLDTGQAGQTGTAHQAGLDEVAFLTLSSGTSGTPKTIPLTHRNVLSRAFAARDFTGIDQTRTLLNWQPLNHIGSLSDWHIRGLCAGSNMIYARNTEILAKPTRWLDWIEQYGVTDTWAPNFAFNRLLNELKQSESQEQRWHLERLRLCLSAGESIAPRIMDEFEDRLRNSGLSLGVLQPAYGLAETASGITYSAPDTQKRVTRRRISEHAREFVSCGYPIAGMSVRIVNDAGELCYEGEIGHIEAQGNPVFSGYDQAKENNSTLFSADGWLRSGDLGFVYDGCLFITGRSKAEINVNGRKLSCESIEMAIGELPDVCAGEVAVCSVAGEKPDTEEVVVFFVAKNAPLPPERWRALRGFITKTFGVIPDHLIAVEPSAIPRTAVGKIRRQLLSEQFAAGAFADLIQRQTPQLANIPDTFYQKHWQRRQLTGLNQPSGPLYIVSKGSALSERLIQRLAHAGFEVQAMHAAALEANQALRVLDITLLETSQASTDMARSVQTAEYLCVLLQDLHNRHPKECQLTVVTCLTQVTGRETEIRFDDAVVHGLIKSAQVEYASWLKCRQVDLDLSSDAMQVDVLIEELCAPEFTSEVVYRQQRRYLPQFKKVRIKRPKPTAQVPYDGTEFVVISGGLGGIGQLLAKHLHDAYGISLLLLGRREPNAADAKFLSDHPRITYAQVNVANRELLNQTISAHEKLLSQPMAGVIHLAGSGSWQDQITNTASYRIENLQSDAWSIQFDAKVTGTHNLFNLVQSRPGASFVATSSVIGEFGGSSFAVYAAANSFLATFCRAQSQLGHRATFCHQWSPWLDTGMSQGQAPEFAAAAGYLSLTPESGLHILMASLINQYHDLIIGLDPNHPRVRTGEPITAYYICRDRELANRYVQALASLPWLIERDDLTFCEVHEIPDQSASHTQSATLAQASDASQTEIKLQAQLRQIFREVMELDQVELDDNFFELGAHSLLMVTLESRIKTSISERIELLDMFRFPTIRRLARHLAFSESLQIDTAATNRVNDRSAQASTKNRLRMARASHRRGRPS